MKGYHVSSERLFADIFVFSEKSFLNVFQQICHFQFQQISSFRF